MTTEKLVQRIENEYGLRIASHKSIKFGARSSFVAKLTAQSGEAFAVKSLFDPPERQRFIVESERLLAERGVQLARPRQTLDGRWFIMHEVAPYVLYEWIGGRGARLNEPNHLLAIVELAARFHKASRQIRYPAGVKLYDHPDWREEYKERLQTMDRWLASADDSDVEEGKKVSIAAAIPFFLKAGRRAYSELKKSGYEAYRSELKRGRGMLVHGDLHHKNVIHSGGKRTLIDFEDVRFDLPSKDLQRIFSMYTKSHPFDEDTFRRMLRRYERLHPVSDEIRRLIHIDLLFPHIFERMLRKKKYRKMSEERLAFLLEQERKKAEFIRTHYFSRRASSKGRRE